MILYILAHVVAFVYSVMILLLNLLLRQGWRSYVIVRSVILSFCLPAG